MKRIKKYTTDFFFSTPNLLAGAGSVINLAGDYYKFNVFANGMDADTLAIEQDFKIVGQDMYNAIEEYQKEVIN